MPFPHPSRPTLCQHKAKRLPPNFTPGRYSVLCGRGKVCAQAPGNKHLRSLIESNLTRYSNAANKNEKSETVSSIVDAVRENAPDGGFVKKDKNGDWWEVGDNFAREKIGSSTKAKSARHKAQGKKWGKRKECSHRDNKGSRKRATSPLPEYPKDSRLSKCANSRYQPQRFQHMISGHEDCNRGSVHTRQSSSRGLPAIVVSSKDFECGLPSYREPRLDAGEGCEADPLISTNRRFMASMVSGDSFFQMFMQQVAELENNFPDDISGIFD